MCVVKRALAVLLLVGGAACKPAQHASVATKGVDPTAAARDWTRRCAHLIESAGKGASSALPDLAHITTKIDTSPWHPIVRFEAHTASGGLYEGAVNHGDDGCIDFSTDAIFPWTDQKPAPPYVVNRFRRWADDDAWLSAKSVPADTVAVFRSTFERALDVCLREAQSVPLGKAPPTTRCIDEADRCPDEGEPHKADDGCP
jgi:hypothetical protein